MCRQRILHTSYDTFSRRTFYEILDLNRDCTAKEIRNAYLQKCKQFHPDSTHSKGEDSKLKFQEINEAYSTLSNQQKRHEYDLTLGSYSSPNYRRTGDLNDFYERVRRREMHRTETHFTQEELRKRAEDVHRQYQQYEQYHREEQFRRDPFRMQYQRMTREHRRRVEEEWYREHQRERMAMNKELMEGEKLFYRLILFFSITYMFFMISGVIDDGYDYRKGVEDEKQMLEDIENERRRRDP